MGSRPTAPIAFLSEIGRAAKVNVFSAVFARQLVFKNAVRGFSPRSALISNLRRINAGFLNRSKATAENSHVPRVANCIGLLVSRVRLPQVRLAI